MITGTVLRNIMIFEIRYFFYTFQIISVRFCSALSVPSSKLVTPVNIYTETGNRTLYELYRNPIIVPPSTYNYSIGKLTNHKLKSTAEVKPTFKKLKVKGGNFSKQVKYTKLGETLKNRNSLKYAEPDESEINENYFEILKIPKPKKERFNENQKNESVQVDIAYKKDDQKSKTHLDFSKNKAVHKNGPKSIFENYNKVSGGGHFEGENDFKAKKHYHQKGIYEEDNKNGKEEYKEDKVIKANYKEFDGQGSLDITSENRGKENKESDTKEYEEGRSASGGHVMHMKDEYEQKQEFYDEYHEDGDNVNHEEQEDVNFEDRAQEKDGRKSGKVKEKGDFQEENFFEDEGNNSDGSKNQYSHNDMPEINSSSDWTMSKNNTTNPKEQFSPNNFQIVVPPTNGAFFKKASDWNTFAKDGEGPK